MKSAMCSGAAGASAELVTLPMDTIKVAMQITKGESVGVFPTLQSLVKREGVFAPWKGLSAGVQRQLVFATLRMSLYAPIRDLYCGGQSGPPTLMQRILAGLTSGAIGMLVANPTDLVKIRLQADARRPPGAPPRYTGSIDAYRRIVVDEGFFKLWTGVGPNIVRNSIICSSELAAYDTIKIELLKRKLMKDGLPLHFTAALGAGFVTTIVGSPVDVLKTRIMNAKPGDYKGPIDCVVKTLGEGPMAFYRGFWVNFARLGTFNVAIFVFFEQFVRIARSF
ncbi:unnamed protein product [Vitrella brassicaformis CCMP3155]|uniref:Uncharacterized protein n=2 Tax=Vitrella brassicaformis TaxID=1169539 RepID=A0A0G4GV95_VITBC|nr:unnamed protein product [Vitrella brassicaformis CCMP3155]|eukprot:CEM34782.1 unnamed protein product [Vitrella brassicaformis CCMP3155]